MNRMSDQDHISSIIAPVISAPCLLAAYSNGGLTRMTTHSKNYKELD